MTHLDILTFARGSALNWALMVFVAGVTLRLFEILGFGRKADLAKPRAPRVGSGWRTMFTRSLPERGILRRDPVTYISGYVFHTGLFLSLIFWAAHRILSQHDRLFLAGPAYRADGRGRGGRDSCPGGAAGAPAQ